MCLNSISIQESHMVLLKKFENFPTGLLIVISSAGRSSPNQLFLIILPNQLVQTRFISEFITSEFSYLRIVWDLIVFLLNFCYWWFDVIVRQCSLDQSLSIIWWQFQPPLGGEALGLMISSLFSLLFLFATLPVQHHRKSNMLIDDDTNK